MDFFFALELDLFLGGGGGDYLNLTEKPPQSNSRLIKIWVKFAYCYCKLPKKSLFAKS